MPMTKEELDEYLNNVLKERKAAKETKGNLGLIGGMAQISNNQGTLFDPKRGPSVAAGMAKQYGEDIDSDIDNRTKVADYLLGKKTQEAIAEDNRKSAESREDLKYQRDKDLLGVKGEQSLKELEAKGKSETNKALLVERERQKAAQNKEKEPNQTQYQDALYARRMEQASSVIDQLADTGYNRASTVQGLKTYLPRQLQGEELKKQEQAERNFVNAVLRKESGAAISPTEFESASLQYFPRAGDTPDVLAQKKQNRDQAVAGIRAAAGRAWDKTPEVALASSKKNDSPLSENKAIAAPEKNPEEMSDEELDAELAKLKGKK